MSKVFKIGITDKNNKKINEVKSIEVLENKGVVGDRHFDEFNDPYCQLSLIESENIDFYNSKYKYAADFHLINKFKLGSRTNIPVSIVRSGGLADTNRITVYLEYLIIAKFAYKIFQIYMLVRTKITHFIKNLINRLNIYSL